MTDTPKKITIRGGAFNTAYPGNGVFLDGEHMAEMASDFSKGHFVRDHDTGVSGIAGVVKALAPERFDVTHNFDVRGKKVQRKVKATRVKYEAELSEEWPGFADVAKSIAAHEKNGLTPNVSIMIKPSGLGFDQETETFHLLGPYKFVHLGHVSVGAQKPDQGVGVESVKFEEGALKFSDEDRELPITTSFAIADELDLIADFCAEFADQPDVIEKLGQALGRDIAPEENPPEEPITVTDDEPAEMSLDVVISTGPYRVSVQPAAMSSSDGPVGENTDVEIVTDSSTSNNPDGKNPIGQETRRPEQQVESPMTDKQEDPKVESTPPAPVAAPAVDPTEFSMLKEQLAQMSAMLQKREELDKQREQAEIKAMQESIVLEFGVPAERVALFATKEALAAFKDTLAEKWNNLPLPGSHQMSEEVDEEEKERRSWLQKESAKFGLEVDF